MSANDKESIVSKSSVAEFTDALYGPRGALDSWLECNSEDEVRAHILHLIAAEPELFDSLQDAVCALEVCGKDFDYVMGKARAAIAKARGEA